MFQSQAVILYVQALRDLHTYPLAGLTDSTVTVHMHYDHKDIEGCITSAARYHRFVRLQQLYQVIDEDSYDSATPDKFTEMTDQLEELVIKQLKHLEVSAFSFEISSWLF